MYVCILPKSFWAQLYLPIFPQFHMHYIITIFHWIIQQTMYKMKDLWLAHHLFSFYISLLATCTALIFCVTCCRVRLKPDGTRAETRFHLLPKRTSPLYRWWHQFSRPLAAEVCASAVVMLDTPHSEAVWEYWLPIPFTSFPFTSPPVHHHVPSCFKRTVLVLALCHSKGQSSTQNYAVGYTLILLCMAWGSVSG